MMGYFRGDNSARTRARGPVAMRYCVGLRGTSGSRREFTYHKLAGVLCCPMQVDCVVYA